VVQQADISLPKSADQPVAFIARIDCDSQ